MSRTYRKRNEQEEGYWLLREHTYIHEIDDFKSISRIEYGKQWFSVSSNRLYQPCIVHYSKTSKIGKKILAKYHSDSYSSFREPGPSWFRNLYTERPQRREAKRQLNLYLLNTEFEVILNNKDPLSYWT